MRSREPERGLNCERFGYCYSIGNRPSLGFVT